MAEESDCMEVVGLKFVGVRTFSIAVILIVAYVVLLWAGRPFGALESMVTFVLGFMFGAKGAAVATETVTKLMDNNAKTEVAKIEAAK